MTPKERDEAIGQSVRRMFDKATTKQFTPLTPALNSQLELVFSSTAWGFREILLVIVHASLLNSKYRASVSFYECEPRAIYEGPIRSALIDRAIPHRKSGPLNVAKAAKAISLEWAAQREPAALAKAIVDLVGQIEGMTHKELENFAVALHAKFLDAAQRTASLNVEVLPEADPEFLFSLCGRMINEVPDGGNTPQFICGILLETYYRDLGSKTVITGGRDRASVTSTTSGKPGDIAEVREDGSLLHCYEVTVKKFDQRRVEECSDAFQKYNAGAIDKISEVTVLCRPEDCPKEAANSIEAALYLGALEYEGIVYYFSDIFEWIVSQLLRMTAKARLGFFEELQNYVDQSNTSEKVKIFWGKCHAELRKVRKK